MKTWKKIVGLTTITGVALGCLAYFAKKKSLEDDFSDEFDDAFDDFDDEIKEKTSSEDEQTNRNYVPLDIETPSTANKNSENEKLADNKDDNSKKESSDAKAEGKEKKA